MTLFETIRVEASGPRLLDAHVARMRASCRRLELPLPPPAGEWRVDGAPGLVRVTWDGVALTSARRPLPPEGTRRLLPVRWEAPALAAHKVTDRERYAAARARARAAGCDDALLVDAQGFLLEASTANVFARLGGRLVTPPLDGRILPGVWRAALIAEQGAEERPLSLTEARTAEEILVTSAGATVAGAQIGGGAPAKSV